MLDNSVIAAVQIALQWTDKFQAIKGSPSKERLSIVFNEYICYSKATTCLYILYMDLQDPFTSQKYPIAARKDISDQLAFPVECMIYRAQQMLATVLTGTKLHTEILQILFCLRKVSDILLTHVEVNCLIEKLTAPPPAKKMPTHHGLFYMTNSILHSIVSAVFFFKRK